MNITDINIIDLDGRVYDINHIIVQGNDVINIVIKKPSEAYTSKRVARELVDEITMKTKKTI